ncbi:uncharacterized protein LOC110706215 [Chenopodium quinoa]|uniref:uncharacterized protein LOC110706215 n=1 Tax=Chenopodium quinoa TaxID=63459 RepID=UPI000B770298|nr:uncharacterized protein LOC110706215 [Chenopodium quinoa]XP_021739810.1 uncharacterized protein LOC110706215 [Chenopodium quinoa]
MEDIGPMRCPTHLNNYLRQKEHMKTYNCDGCKMDGHGQSYMCTKCDYVLHLQCMFPSNKIAPSFLQNDKIFEFMKEPRPLPKPSYKRYCDACGFEVKGFVYHCFKMGFDLHPCCASLGSHLEIDGQIFTLKKDSAPKKCDLCGTDDAKKSDVIDSGWFYASKNKDYKCHVSCIMNLAIKSTIKGNSSINDGMALANLELLPTVNKRRSGRDGSKYWRILKAIVVYVISIAVGDPTTIMAKLAVESVVQLGALMF